MRVSCPQAQRRPVENALRGPGRNTMTTSRASSTSTSTPSTRCWTARPGSRRRSSTPTPPRSSPRRCVTACRRVAMTDHGAMFGALRFYEAGRAVGIKPIIGVEAYVAPGIAVRPQHRGERGEVPPPHAARRERDGLPQPPEARVRGLPRGLLPPAPDGQGAARRARRGRDRASPGCLSSEIVGVLLAGQERRAARGGRPRTATSSAPTGSSSSCRTTASPTSARSCAEQVALARELGIPLVATNDLHYTREGGREAARRAAVHPAAEAPDATRSG